MAKSTHGRINTWFTGEDIFKGHLPIQIKQEINLTCKDEDVADHGDIVDPMEVEVAIRSNEADPVIVHIPALNLDTSYRTGTFSGNI